MSQEKVLVVENSLQDRDLIARQALKPLGYDVKTAELASTGIQLALSFHPDLIITNLTLPDLSGKDLLVALHSQNIDTPVVLVANAGQEQDVVQAFRLGATDVIKKPLREAEVVATVERAVQNVRARRERDQLAKQLQENNRELQRRVRDLTALVAAGKTILSATRQQEMFIGLVDSAAKLTGSQRAYLLLRADSKNFHLTAFHNLPRTLSDFLNKPFDDGVSSLVAMSGKSLAIHGNAVKRFKIGQLGKAALVAPIHVRKEAVGLLVCIRTTEVPFKRLEQKLLESVADYAAISMVHMQRVRTLEQVGSAGDAQKK